MTTCIKLNIGFIWFIPSAEVCILTVFCLWKQCCWLTIPNEHIQLSAIFIILYCKHRFVCLLWASESLSSDIFEWLKQNKPIILCDHWIKAVFVCAAILLACWLLFAFHTLRYNQKELYGLQSEPVLCQFVLIMCWVGCQPLQSTKRGHSRGSWAQLTKGVFHTIWSHALKSEEPLEWCHLSTKFTVAYDGDLLSWRWPNNLPVHGMWWKNSLFCFAWTYSFTFPC